jgi:hypothetical protein
MFHNNKNNIIDLCYTIIIISSTQDKGFMEKRGRFIEKDFMALAKKEERKKEGTRCQTKRQQTN